MALNHVADRVRVCPLAISNQEGTALLYTIANCPENTLSAIHGRLPDEHTRQNLVNVTTIDSFCASQSLIPDIIKIDIEGFELHALRGARQTLSRQRPVVVWPGPRARQGARAGTIAGAASVGGGVSSSAPKRARALVGVASARRNAGAPAAAG